LRQGHDVGGGLENMAKDRIMVRRAARKLGAEDDGSFDR
jgi:hypothetical protein